MIARKDITAPAAFQNYINKAGDDDLHNALRKNTKNFRKLLKDIPRKKVDFAYAEGKWTIKQLLQHIIDAERVFVLRALWFTRKDPSPQPGFEENIWAANADVSERKWKAMVEEFFLLRAATESFFESLSEEALLRAGSSNSNMITPAAFAFICAGHVEHHIDIINERYLATGKKPAKEKTARKK